MSLKRQCVKIYLVAKEPFEGVENLILSRVEFCDFNVDLRDFEALICTSKNALKALEKAKIPLEFKGYIYVVGEKTAQEAKRMGFERIKIPTKAYGAVLFEEFKYELLKKNCLYLRGERVLYDIKKAMQKEGARIEERVVYKSMFVGSKMKLKQPGIFIFTSPLGVENFLRYFSFHQKDKIIALGESTAKKLPKENLFISPEPKIESCVALAKKLKG